jgi:hypothetical protein
MLRGRGAALAALGAVVATVAVAVAGCGGDSDGAARENERDRPVANEEPETFALRVAKLLATSERERDCPQLEQILDRGLTRFSCPPGKAFAKSMASFGVVGAAEYGTGGVVDYRSGRVEDGAAIVLFVAPDRSWAISNFGVVTERSVGTSDGSSRDGFARAIDDYLSAVRARDCKAFRQVAYTGSAKADEVCETIFPTTESLAERLKRNPDARPSYEGGNRIYGFYSLETAKPKPENSTISIARDTAGDRDAYYVLSVAPSPTAAVQRRAIEQLKEGERVPAPAQPKTSPSRKADS